LEHRSFVLKDSQFVIDDYAPTPLDYRETELKALGGSCGHKAIAPGVGV
jgi:hypothetical protein